ncbi:MAG: serine/threonine protein kinase [Chloroflexi bacterium]|nr:serine/threonine protein kinase [Chloroflexota bacterium]
MITSKPVTPSTSTHTSLKDRPTLRFALQAAWVSVVVYILYTFAVGLSLTDVMHTNLLRQIARVGLNLLTFSAIDIISDIYILLGYFGLAVMLFIRRSDDWFAIFLSVMIMTFGVSVTSIGNNLAASEKFGTLASPILMAGQASIVLLGWLYPDGRFNPRWLRYLTPFLFLTMIVFYWPGSPISRAFANLPLFLLVSLFWYLGTVVVMVSRYHTAATSSQRQHIRMVFIGMMGPLAWFILFNGGYLLFPSLQNQTAFAGVTFLVVMRFLSIGLFLIFPLALTIAIARYRLFDVDLVINRALVYGALTTALVTIFGFVLLLVNALWSAVMGGRASALALTVSAVAAGALFQPTRKFLQRFVDRFIYHIHIDYLKTPVGPRKKGGSDTDATLSAPALFSNYSNLSLIGKGGMAEVYRAEDTTHGREVAIKVLLSNLAEDEQFRKRFQREAQALAGLEHPNIVRLYDYGIENNLYFMVMEYLNGLSLSSALRQGGKMDMDMARPILSNIADALDYAHAAGLVHRDIKPSNVMLDSSRGSLRAVLTDFGIVKMPTTMTNITESAVIGTFDYIAPEQIQATGQLDGRADIYALGVMAYQMLTGALPFKRNSPGALLLAHMTAPAPDIREVEPTTSQNTARAIQKAMAKEPVNRFATAREFVAAL